MRMNAFERVLRQENYAENTIVAYTYAVRDFYAHFTRLDKSSLLAYKNLLIDSHKPKTVNLRIRAINKYLQTIGKFELQLKSLKVQNESFLENVISADDYTYFKNRLNQERNREWYFAIWFMAATGARISELVRLRVEHVQSGFYDVYSKGGKIRRLYIPKQLREEILQWLDRDSGYLFLNRYGERITTRGVASRLAFYAQKYGINPAVVHPHAFRHRFAKNFLEKHSDLALLADLLGHENISTTRIYLRKSSVEQRTLIEQIVDW